MQGIYLCNLSCCSALWMIYFEHLVKVWGVCVCEQILGLEIRFFGAFDQPYSQVEAFGMSPCFHRLPHSEGHQIWHQLQFIGNQKEKIHEQLLL